MKRRLCMILAAAMLCAAFPQMTFAADFATAQQTVKALGILSDTSSATATRGEFAKMLVSASEYKDEVEEEGISALYPDVPKSHWASEYIRVAVEKGWMTGSVNGKFRVNDGIRTEEAAASLLELLGYDPASLAGTFPYAQISKAKALGLADGISFTKGETLTKQDCVYLFYNLMNADTATGQSYAETLGYSMSGDTLNYSAIVSEDLKGPFVLETDGGLSAVVPFSIGAVYKNGVASTAAEAKAYDVYYYNEGMQTVWLYSNHVTGTYTAASPNAVAPETATVAGCTYKLEAAAAYKLSTLGDYKIGDIVTLLIGMDGSAVDVVSTSAYSGSYIGIVTSTGVTNYVDETGVATVDEVLYVTCTDGTTRTFTADDDDYEAGDLVSITFSGSDFNIKELNKRTLSGTVSKDGTKIGSREFADDVKIINVSQDGSATRIYVSKLLGVSISSNDVYYYAVNNSNEITDLILYDAVSEGRGYGIVYSVDESYTGEKDEDGERETLYTFKYIMDGVVYTGTSTNSVKSGPAVFRMVDGTWTYSISLPSKSLSSVDYLTAYSGSTKLGVSEEVQCYIKTDSRTYTKVNINTMDAEKYYLEGYTFDDAVRIIIAREK